MKIKGIGTISKKEAMSILTDEGKKAVNSGEISLCELADMYKYEKTKKASCIGCMTSFFSEAYKWIPSYLKEQLTPEQLGNLVDCFHSCYNEGLNAFCNHVF